LSRGGRRLRLVSCGVVRYLELIRAGLDELRARDRALAVFGASTHRYELLPAVAPRVLEAIEREHGFRFPEEYRRFVLEVGGGGAGPGYGVLPFGMIDDGFGHAPWTTWRLRPGEPFPHRDAWNDVSILEIGAPSPDDFDDHHAYEDARDEWCASDAAHAQQNAYWAAAGTTRGCIPLCHHGCALRDWLVVTGPAAGTVWHDASADDLGIAPIAADDGARAGFAAWYLRWLDGALASVAVRH
jgi:hypothetical protein